MKFFLPPNFSINQFQRGFIKHWMRPVWVDFIQGSQKQKDDLEFLDEVRLIRQVEF